MKITKMLMPSTCVYSERDCRDVLDVGAQGIGIGAVALLRPWRVAGIVKYVLGKKGLAKRKD